MSAAGPGSDRSDKSDGSDGSNFWELRHPRDSPALIDVAADGASISYAELEARADEIADELSRGDRALVFLLCRNDTATLAAYLATLRRGHVACLLDADLKREMLHDLLQLYRPAFVCHPAELPFHADGYEDPVMVAGVATRSASSPAKADLHPELALLLTTSGTTGSHKLVRLTRANLQSNAQSIAQYLELSSDERPIATLPIHYSFGLSVINSHLFAGAATVLTQDSVMQRPFWDAFRNHGCTSLAGVPYTFQLLHRLGFAALELPTLRTVTQAGGRLDVKLQRYLADYGREHGVRVFIMYGQTEASPRISYVPADRLDEGIGSIGIAIPGGSLELGDADGELIYRGPNVMMGYATGPEDLAKGDELGGVLHTGDLARRDANGFFHIVGRRKRFLKLFGLRIGLDDVERQLEEHLGQPCYCMGDDSRMQIVTTDPDSKAAISELIKESYGLHRTAFRIVTVSEIPRLANEKVDYAALQRAIEAPSASSGSPDQTPLVC